MNSTAANLEQTSFLTTTAAGYIAVAISTIGFGTNYLPVKSFNMGDGMFFQWIMCNAVLFIGVIVNIVVGSPQFHPLAMFGGALWALGNSMVVTIIKCIGVGLGILIWSMANLLFGFASSRFGWFGVIQKIPQNTTLNYIGVAIAVGSVFLYAAIKPAKPIENPNEETVVVDDSKPESFQMENSKRNKHCKCLKPLKELSLKQKRVIGVSLSVLTGFLFGNTFNPTSYLQNKNKHLSRDGLDYVFSNFVGIWITSTCIFVIYASLKLNKPIIPSPVTILPALLSGVLWGIAQSSWFVANSVLGEPITFPIITTLPALIATICGLVFFREIRGTRNYILLVIAFCVTVTGVILNALSFGTN